MERAVDINCPDAMAATLKTIAGSGGGASAESEVCMAALAKVELDAANGHIRLGRNRQAVATQQPGSLWEVEQREPYRTIPNVESTFGGYFKPSDPGRARRRRSVTRATRPVGALVTSGTTR